MESLKEFKKELDDFLPLVTSEFKKEAKALSEKFDEALKSYAKGEDVTNIKTTVDGIESTLNELKQTVAGKGVIIEGVNDGKSLMQRIEAKLIDIMGATKDSDKRKAVKEQLAAKQFSVSFEAKAAVDMTRANTNPTAGSRIPAWQREPGVAKAPDNMPFVADLVMIGTLPLSDTVSWVERIDRQGGAASVAEGAAFSKLSMAYEEKSMKAQKIGVLSKATEEDIMDIDFLLSEIQTEIIDGEEGINYTLDEQLFGGNGISPNLKGINTYATTFSAPASLVVSSASNFDVIRAIALQLALAKFRGSYVLLNPIDVAMMDLKKDANGVYILPPFMDANGKRIGGLNIVEHNSIAAGSFLGGDFSKSGLFIRKGLTIAIANQNEDDFTKEFVSIRGSIRAAHRIKGPHTTAFVKGTFANAITDLSA